MTTPNSSDNAARRPDGLLPICEVARQTGVNAATLRAWERRYGLVMPQRSARGHRLYDGEQIARIQQVLAWLARGVSIAEVRRLMPEPPQGHESIGALWDAQRRLWLRHIEQLNERSLDDSFNQARAIYPAETLCLHLLWPLLQQVQVDAGRRSHDRVEQVFFLTWLRSKLGARVYHGNRLLQGPPVLLLGLSDQLMSPGLWLCAWLASNRSWPVRALERAVAPADLALALRWLEPAAVLLYGDRMPAPDYLQRLSEVIDCPQLLCGPAASMHREQLAELPRLQLADDPTAALHWLQRLGLSEHR
jgi:DNA-binding transcriptional MerR regulator